MAGNPTTAASPGLAVKPARVNIFANPGPATTAAEPRPRLASVFDAGAGASVEDVLGRLPARLSDDEGRGRVTPTRGWFVWVAGALVAVLVVVGLVSHRHGAVASPPASR